MRSPVFCSMLLVVVVATGSMLNAAGSEGVRRTTDRTGFAAKRPVFGGACRTCPWGAIADFVKAAVQPYGYDVLICYTCAGGPVEARLVAGAKMPPPYREMPAGIDIARSLIPPPPNGPVDFGATGAQYLWDAYRGIHDFAKDPEGPRKNLRMIANIQEPSYYVVAVKAGSGITDLREIVDKHMPVHILAATTGGQNTPTVLAYYGISKEKMESFGGELRQNFVNPEQRKGVDVVIGWAALENAPEYNMWYDVSQRYDLKYLELPKDLRDKMVKEFDLEEQNLPIGLLRGVDRDIPTIVRTGNVIYGRTDMPDEFAYTLAKAIDEHQNLLQWAQGGMNFSYNWHTVWKAYGVPLHPGAARYYKQRAT
jgi:TRAP transporter TAXI family solute receptor